jgi:hypothetical protein
MTDPNQLRRRGNEELQTATMEKSWKWDGRSPPTSGVARRKTQFLQQEPRYGRALREPHRWDAFWIGQSPVILAKTTERRGICHRNPW